GACRAFRGGRGKRSLHTSLVLDGNSRRRCLRLLRTACLDSGDVLRHRRRRDRDHRSKRSSARAKDAGQRSVPLAYFCERRDHDRLDRLRNCMAVCFVRVISVVVKAAPAFLSKPAAPSIAAGFGWLLTGAQGTASTGLL